MIFKCSYALFQEIGAYLVIFHHTADLELLDAIGYWHLLSCMTKEGGGEDNETSSHSLGSSTILLTYKLPTLAHLEKCCELVSPFQPHLKCISGIG